MTDLVTRPASTELRFQGINYARVWEDHRVMSMGLQVSSDDDVLSICSAGDHVLALALDGAHSVTAVDVNPDQIALLDLQIAAIRCLDHQRYLELLGVAPGDAPSHYARVRRALPEASRQFWDAHQFEIAAGVVNCGRLERFFEAFRARYLANCVDHADLVRLFEFDTLEAQRDWFESRLSGADLELAVRAYFDRSVVAKEGRSEAQYAFVELEDTGSEAWQRVRRMCTTKLLRHNFYLRLVLLGDLGDVSTGPPHLRPENFDRLGAVVDRIDTRVSDVGTVVNERPRGAFSVANLSDIFEYQSADASTGLQRLLADRLRPHGRLGWWCLMVPRPVPAELVSSGALEECGELAAELTAEDRVGFFYESYQLASIPPPLHRWGGSSRAPRAPREVTACSVPARGQYSEPARQARIGWLRESTGLDLSRLDNSSLDAGTLKGNTENFVGSVEIPVGLAGPLVFNGEHVTGPVYAPLATTEGALVASACRGAAALSRSGGVVTRVAGQQMMRAPLFRFGDLVTARRFTRWIQDHLADLRVEVARHSRHAELNAVEPFQIGPDVHVRFVYRTADAAGQNMTTICTWQACKWVLEQFRGQRSMNVEQFFLEGYMSGDKKVTALSWLAGRGVAVDAEVILPRSVVHDVLKSTPEELMTLYVRGFSGAVKSGAIDYNANVANVVAAMFTATGQDIACVHESSLGLLSLDAIEEGLYASLSLPGLAIGTVGGGTGLPAQRDCLELLGCRGPGTVGRLAEIIAGFALALDLSTLSAVATGSFAAAHESLGRNRPVSPFSEADLTPAFFEAGLRQHLGDPDLSVTAVLPLDSGGGSAIISEQTSQQSSGAHAGEGATRGALVGLRPFRLSYRRGDGSPGAYDVVVKAKAPSDNALLLAQKMASLCGTKVGEAFRSYGRLLPLANADRREIAIARLDHPALRAHMPGVVHTLEDPQRDAYVVVQELLGNDAELLDSVSEPHRWDGDAIRCALDGIAACHAVHLGETGELRAAPWLAPVVDSVAMGKLALLWEGLAEHVAGEFPDLMRPGQREVLSRLIATIPIWWQELETMPTTLVHNDFSPRNIALRRRADGSRSLVAYDWELATVHVPQRDLAELLAFVLPDDVDGGTVGAYVEHHRSALERAAGTSLDPCLWRRGYALALCDFVVSRVLLLAMVHTFRELEFMEGLWCRSLRLLALEAEAGNLHDLAGTERSARA